MLRIKSNTSSSIRQHVALKSMSIDSKICSFGADVNITQLFRNDEDQAIEAVYCFPIEENAAIYSFIAKIDDREICAQLKEKVQAQRDYTQALQQGHGAYLMEQDEKSQDIFVINVGALLPGKECQIQIKYVTELVLVNGKKTRFVVPTTIAPRYNPSVGSVSSPAGTQTQYVQSAPYTVNFRCQIDKLNEQVTGVSSSSHPMTIQFNATGYEVTFSQQNTSLDRDIILDIDLSTRTNTILALEKTSSNQIALMASFTPTLEDCRKALNANKESNKINNEFIFIVDCSGSMQDENKIGLARQAMILFLKSLPVNCQFNIIRFGSHYQTLFNQVTNTYNEQTAKQAEQLITHMSADLGGTELLKPLQWLQTQPPAVNHSRQILLLTDGEISNVSAVTDLCRLMSTSSRIFSFGLGHSPSRALIKGLARSTNGRFTFIPPGTSVDIHVAEQLEKALEPCITNVKVQWNIPALNSSQFQTAPTVVPPVYANDRLLFYALIESNQFDHSTTVELWNEEHTIRLGLSIIDHVPEIINNDNQLITHLAAKALIQEIIHEKEPCPGSQQKRFEQVKQDDQKQRLIDISLRYNILCPHTAFIGIETRTNPSAKSDNSNMLLREIPIQISATDEAATSRAGGFGILSSMSSCAMPMSQCRIPQMSPQYAISSQSKMCSIFPQPTSISNFHTMQEDHFGSSRKCKRSIGSSSSFTCNLYQQQQMISPLVPLSVYPMSKRRMTPSSSPSSITEEKTWPSNDQDIVRHLIQLQNFDGVWNLNDDQIQHLCQKTLISFRSDITDDPNILVTAIVISILETKYNAFKTMWSSIVNKARNRLGDLMSEHGKLEQLFNHIHNQF